MAENYKILGQDLATSINNDVYLNEANTVYSVPQDTAASISSIRILNSSNSIISYSLGVVKAADAANSVLPTARNFPMVTVGNYSNESYYSTDGITWTAGALPGRSYWNIEYFQGKYIAIAMEYGMQSGVEQFPGLYESSDGINWSAISTPSLVSHIDSKIIDFVASEKGFFFYGYNSTALPMGSNLFWYHSSDLITWTELSLTQGHPWSYISLNTNKNVLSYGNGKFVVFGYDKSAYSTDGLVWTEVTSPAIGGQAWTMTYGNGQFVAIGNYGSAVSTDGISWTSYAFVEPVNTLSGNFTQIVYGNGKYVASSYIYGSDAVVQSVDGTTWSAIITSESYGIASRFNNFYILGFSSPGQTSTDAGMTWTTNNIPPYQNAITAGEDAVGDLKTILSTQTIIPTRTIEPGAVDEIVGGITLSAGDQIRVYSESEDLIVHIYGVEHS